MELEMDASEEVRLSQKECVKVAVNIRPLISSEFQLGCQDCVTVVPGEPQVQIGSHSFTYDHVYGSSALPSSCIFEECIAPLVDAVFHGYNATVLAYGQTGSGKTYTMGTNFAGEGNNKGIIPHVMSRIFNKVDELKKDTEFLIRVSFIEIFKEEVFDLLDLHANAALRIDNNSIHARPSRPPIQIRETANGGITLAGVTEAEVKSQEEMVSYLMRGSQSRATGSTNMNSQSSRSHAIFTICLEQKKNADCCRDGSATNDFFDEILLAKFHLVDLAGSERAKRTGADGLRLKEGIHINKGLLALGNVISALGDEKKRKDGGHVPYRDSKLTRLLQDSLGGNSKTVMIACISPADSNAEETINTLKYANRARNIQNKAVINRDPALIEVQKLRIQLEQLQSEVLFYRGSGAPFEELQVLRERITLLEENNADLHKMLKDRQVTCHQLSKHALDAQVEKDKLILKIESARSGKPWDEIDRMEMTQKLDLLSGYVSRIQELETELLRYQNSYNPSQSGFMDCVAIEKDSILPCLDDLGLVPDGRGINDSNEAEEDEKEREHSSLQDRLDKELQELDKKLEQKEAEMKRFAKVDTSVLRQHYEKKLMELEQEKKFLQKEIEQLRFNLANISSTSSDSAQQLKEEYLHKLTLLESQVSELKKKQEAQSQLLRQKQKSDDAAKRLHEDIQRIKSQKVQLQQKIKQESEQFRLWKASREKEVLQLKKEGRRNEYEMHKLLALNQRQKMVLQRKTEEASVATRKLKELLEAKKASFREASGTGHHNPGMQALMQAIEHELEVIVRVHEVRSEYERQMQEKTAMAKEVARLKEESEISRLKILSDCPQTMSPSARNSRIAALENMLATSSSTLVFMASELSEAEERERLINGKGRWNQVRSLGEAKHLMNHLFNLASISRCHLRDKEVICRERDSFISELKEKVYRLNSLVRQLEAQKAVQNDASIKMLASTKDIEPPKQLSRPEKCFDLKKGPEKSIIFNPCEVVTDMDTSDSEEIPKSDDSDEDWVESGKIAIKRRTKEKKIYNEYESTTDKDGHICCSCSKSSSCKTKKCECRALDKSCNYNCGCITSKCANREEPCSSLGDDKDKGLISQGTLLLTSALNERQNISERKPLSDIGNAQVNRNSEKPKKRKNWRKTTIQLVPEQVEATTPAPQSKEVPGREDIRLRLPRAMETTMSLSNHPPFSDMNSVRSDELTNTNKDDRGIGPPRSPARLRNNAPDEKENKML